MARYKRIVKEKFVGGIAWAFGVTVGFALVSIITVYAFSQVGGLPLIGTWIAGIVESVQQVLLENSSDL